MKLCEAWTKLGELLNIIINSMWKNKSAKVQLEEESEPDESCFYMNIKIETYERDYEFYKLIGSIDGEEVWNFIWDYSELIKKAIIKEFLKKGFYYAEIELEIGYSPEFGEYVFYNDIIGIVKLKKDKAEELIDEIWRAIEKGEIESDDIDIYLKEKGVYLTKEYYKLIIIKNFREYNYEIYGDYIIFFREKLEKDEGLYALVEYYNDDFVLEELRLIELKRLN